MKKPVGRTIVFNEKKMAFGGGSSVPDIKYADLFNLYVKDCKLRNIEEVTIQGYRNAHRYFLQFAGEDINCSDINQELIDDYMISLAERLKPQSVNSYVFKVSPIVLFGVARGYIKHDIKFSHMVEQEQFKEIYHDEEIRLLLEKPEGNSFADYRCWVIVNLLLGTGIRAQVNCEKSKCGILT